MSSDTESCLPPPAHEHQPAAQRAFLHFNACSPAIVVFVCLYLLDDLVAAVFAFQLICMVVLPVIYICCIMHDGIKTYEVLMRRLLRNWRKQALQAIVGFVVVTLVGFGIYLSIQTLPFLHRGKIVATAKEDKLNSRYFTVTTATLFALEFTFVNSLLEELFWRIYLHRELGGHTGVTATDPSRYSTASSLFPLFGAGTRTAVDSPLQHAEVSESSLLKNAELHNSVAPTTFVSDDDNSGSMRGADSSDEGGDNSISSMGLPASETPKLLLSAYYASYHVVVMVFFVQWWLAFLGFLGLVVLGRIFVFCRESEHLGVVTAWGIHAGADAAFCLIMLQLYFHFAR